MFEKALKSPQLAKAAEQIAAGAVVRLSGAWGSAAPMLAAAIGRLARRPVLYVAGHLDDADEAADDIEVLTGSAAELFPAWEVDIGTEHVNDEVAGERLRLCNLLARVGKPPASPGKLTAGVRPRSRKSPARDLPRDLPDKPTELPAGDRPPPVIVAPIMALLQPVPSLATLEQSRLTLAKGMALDPEGLATWLVDGGYELVEQVDQQGEFARRGGIVDVFPAGVPQAVRVEFFGEEIESIRRFDLDSQRSTDEIQSYDLTALTAGRETAPDRTATLLSYLPADTLIVMSEPAEVRDLAGELYRRVSESASRFAGSALRSPEELFDAFERLPRVQIYTFSPTGGGTIELGIRSMERIAINTHEAMEELTELSKVATIHIYCENPAEEKRFDELLRNAHPALAQRARLAVGHVNTGFYWPDREVVVVGHHEIFHRYAKVRRIRRIRAGRPLESLLDLQAGDYVVHVQHGIAKFEGLRTLARDGKSEEYLTLKFAESAVLHVPASRINLVQKYVGARQKRPSLSHLGGSGWLRQKQKVAEAVKDMAADLLRIQALRHGSPGLSYPKATPWQDQFAEEFLYSETEDQLSAMQQIDSDMVEPRPMDRLLCGDVGYGKTELAMRSAFKVAESGKQVAVLVPTTVLAAQHYRTFTERFADYPFAIDMLSRFRKRAEQTQVLKDLANGQIDIIIGTHRLLSQDVLFRDLGLVVVDEEQRFGVEHKERLKAIRATVDILTMTATPIPRTLHMALLGLRDISSLTTAPMDRRAIHTEVVHYDDKLIREAILRELNRQGQVFFLHNRVGNIQSVADHIKSLVAEARVDVAHGQMPEGHLEKAMLRLVNRKTDVLVCTTIIESGLDIPTANTMIIHNADRFGLSELHQLRGRVGRYKHRAFCYLLLPEDRPVSPTAAKRLKAIEEFSDLGAGFQIAMRDLEIRGAGNILGPEQSGHIATVGYELYCQMLEQAVKQEKGEPPPVRHEVHVELNMDAYIPRNYVPADRQRMEVYRRMVACATVEEIQKLAGDLADAYGPVPPAMQTLLDMAEIRVRASGLGIVSIIRMDPDIVFNVRDFSRAKRLFDGSAGTVRLPDDHTVHWRLPPAYLEGPTLVTVLLRRLRTAVAPV